MNINVLQLHKGNRVFLIEDIFESDLLSRIHDLCSNCSGPDWVHPDWTKLRKIYSGQDSAFLELKQYLSSGKFVNQLEEIIGKKMTLVDLALWADYPGFGPLLPHVELHGQGQGQIFFTKKEYDTNGTAILNDDKKLLFIMPYRDNYGWYFDQCTQVMHGRPYEVPDDIVRYSLIYWHNYET